MVLVTRDWDSFDTHQGVTGRPANPPLKRKKCTGHYSRQVSKRAYPERIIYETKKKQRKKDSKTLPSK